MDCALEDRDGLGVDLCRRLGPLLRNARAQSVLSQSNQATNETMARLASCEVNKINERAAPRKRHGPAVVITQQLATPSVHLPVRQHQLGHGSWWAAVSRRLPQHDARELLEPEVELVRGLADDQVSDARQHA